MALLFWAFAAATVGGALFVVTRRNLIAAVMGMVGSFLGIAAVYMMLYAHFLAVIQMLVYAGAIMVLFVFVIMILNRPEDEPVAPTGRVGPGRSAALAIVYLVGRLVDAAHPRPAAEPAPRSPRRAALPIAGRPSDRLGLGEGGRHRPVRPRPVPVRGDLDPAARRRGRRDRDRAAAPRGPATTAGPTSSPAEVTR